MPSIQNKLIRHQIFLERFAGSVANTIQRGLDSARDAAIVAMINGIDNVNTRQLQQDLERLMKVATNQALEEIKELSLHEADFNARILKKELEDVAEATEAAVLAALLNKAMPVGLSDKKANRKLEPALNSFAKNTAKNLTQPVKDSQITGGDVLAAAATITALTGGLLAVQSKSLSRAGTGHAAQTAGEEVYKANNEIEYVEWVSVLDSGTTDYCRAHDGRRYPIGVGPRPKAHYNCRSITRPLVPGVDYEVGEKVRVSTT
jgi:NADH dehydrogenase/NADH:ubiquinone oxidoreductase subunit G